MSQFDPESSETPEAYIPYLRRDVIEKCVQDGGLPPDRSRRFGELCEILCAHLHFECHRYVDDVKEHYAPFDPDRDTQPSETKNNVTLKNHEDKVEQLFRAIADRANYFEVTEADIEKCFEASTLIKLQTTVDLDDFDQVLCFARGDIYKTATVRQGLKKKEVPMDILQRVILLLKYKDETYFDSLDEKKKKKKKKEQSPLFQPGKIYAYFYKDVPKYDLELLFPNVEVGMTLKDKLFFAVPALGGSVGVLLKAIPQIMIIAGVILFFTAGPAYAIKLGVTDESVSRIMPVLTALMGVTIALGGLAFKQWSNYRKKRIAFLKDVSEQLFFRNLATNQSVFYRLIDSAEEEEGKEMILVLYHLLTGPEEGLNREDLDGKVEAWMKEKFETVIDFDIDGPLNNLSRLKGPARDGSEASLIKKDSEGRWSALPIEDAKHLLDYLWDNAYQYAG